MKIVIDIDEDIYGRCREYRLHCGEAEVLEGAVVNGAPLPKNHGRLIDADELKSRMKIGYRIVDEVPTIIEAESEEEE